MAYEFRCSACGMDLAGQDLGEHARLCAFRPMATTASTGSLYPYTTTTPYAATTTISPYIHSCGTCGALHYCNHPQPLPPVLPTLPSPSPAAVKLRELAGSPKKDTKPDELRAQLEKTLRYLSGLATLLGPNLPLVASRELRDQIHEIARALKGGPLL